MWRLCQPFRSPRRVRAFPVAEARERGITTTSAEMHFFNVLAWSLAACKTHVSKKRDMGHSEYGLFRHGPPAKFPKRNF